MPSSQDNQRTVKTAIFAGNRGAISIETLMAMPSEQWEHLRGAITKQWTSDPENPLAVCLLCKKPVFIRAQSRRNGSNLPVYRHYSNREISCPWHSGENMTPDNARAAQYEGRQESALHKALCEQVAALAGADFRRIDLAVDTYRRLETEKRGLWPDVFVKLDGLGSFALEVQLSKPFLPEISNRTLKYERAEVALVWIFHGIIPGVEEFPQGFRDVIASQRGNVFVLDSAAIEESIKRKTLMLQCYRRNADDSFRKPKLIGLDDIKRGKFGSYFEDCLTPSIIKVCQSAREKWWSPLKERSLRIRSDHSDDGFLEPGFETAYASLCFHVPEIREWKQLFGESVEEEKDHLYRVIAILFSIAGTAHFGKERNYATIETNIVAMLNSKLNGERFRPYAQLIELMLSRTNLGPLLERKSLQNKIAKSKKMPFAQVTIDHPIGQVAKHLFPEVFDGNIRDTLTELDALPAWARTG